MNEFIELTDFRDLKILIKISEISSVRSYPSNFHPFDNLTNTFVYLCGSDQIFEVKEDYNWIKQQVKNYYHEE